MKYSIVYSSMTGNTALLANAVRDALGEDELVYFGSPDEKALEAEIIYAGFWTDKGSCDAKSAEFLKTLRSCRLFLFGTAGFGTDSGYFERIIAKVSGLLDTSVSLAGSFMCQGKMPPSVRERYEKMKDSPNPSANLDMLLENFDLALSHPDNKDLAALKKAVKN